MSTALTDAECAEFEECERIIEEGLKQMHGTTETIYGTLPAKVHPVAEWFPMHSAEEFEGLKRDIEEHGLREDVVFQNGVLLDGRNRIAACLAVGVEWKGHAAELDADIDPVAYILSHNLHRRSLTTSQRAMVGAKLREMHDDAARERQLATLKKGAKSPVVEAAPERGRRARDEAGKAVGVSGKSIDAATAVIKSGNASLVADVEAGRVTVTNAAKQLKADQDCAAEIVERIKSGGSAEPKSSGPTQWDALLKRYASAARLFDELVAERRSNAISDEIISHHEAIEALIPKYRKSITNTRNAGGSAK